MGPIDYSINVQQPFEAAIQGLQVGAGLQAMQAQQQQKQLALQQQQQMQLDLAAVTANPNSSGKDYAALTMKYPALKDQFKQSWDMVSKDHQASKLDMMTRAYSALSTGRPDIAEKLMRDQAVALRNSGASEQEVKAQDMWANMIAQAPDHARHIGGLMLSSVMDPDKFSTMFSTLGDQGRKADAAPDELVKTKTEINNLNSQIQERSARLGLDQDKLTSEYQFKMAELKQKAGELPEYVSKDLSAATMDAITAQQSASRMNDLAAQIDKSAADLGSGVTAKTGELWKKTFGSQNELTRIRAEFSRIVTPAAMAAYKKVASGSTSDKDIDTAMVGVPKDTDSPERMASFLRGAAKLQQYDNALNNAKAEWLGSVKNLGKAQQDINVDGVQVPAGTTFKQFTDQYVEQKVKALTGQAEAAAKAQQVQGRSYMRFAQPGAQ